MGIHSIKIALTFIRVVCVCVCIWMASCLIPVEAIGQPRESFLTSIHFGFWVSVSPCPGLLTSQTRIVRAAEWSRGFACLSLPPLFWDHKHMLSRMDWLLGFRVKLKQGQPALCYLPDFPLEFLPRHPDFNFESSTESNKQRMPGDKTDSRIYENSAWGFLFSHF